MQLAGNGHIAPSSVVDTITTKSATIAKTAWRLEASDSKYVSNMQKNLYGAILRVLLVQPTTKISMGTTSMISFIADDGIVSSSTSCNFFLMYVRQIGAYLYVRQSAPDSRRASPRGGVLSANHSVSSDSVTLLVSFSPR